MLYRFVLVLLCHLICVSASWAETDVGQAMDRAQQRSGELREQTQSVIEQADALANSPEFIDSINREATKALQGADSLPISALPNLPEPSADLLQRARRDITKLLDQAQGQPLDPMGQKSGPQLYVFVSFSMPEITLKRLLTQTSQIEASLILRGLIDDDMGKTKTRIAQLLEADENGHTRIQGGFAIDPTLFERFDIQQVPSFVLTDTPAPRCTDAGCEEVSFARLSGDTTLQYALQTMQREAPAMKSSATELLSRIRGGNHDL
ncbi:MAG: type-F conjugative transfer system pilin assembly protein TrbC [Candidatus Thiodiazotropha sp. LLP2]